MTSSDTIDLSLVTSRDAAQIAYYEWDAECGDVAEKLFDIANPWTRAGLYHRLADLMQNQTVVYHLVEDIPELYRGALSDSNTTIRLLRHLAHTEGARANRATRCPVTRKDKRPAWPELEQAGGELLDRIAAANDAQLGELYNELARALLDAHLIGDAAVLALIADSHDTLAEREPATSGHSR